MSKVTRPLTLAGHKNPAAYWNGGPYELNLSFEMLRDKQWQRIMQTIWEQPVLHGPLSGRYIPGQPIPEQVPVQTPPPTAAMTQHGVLKVGEVIVGPTFRRHAPCSSVCRCLSRSPCSAT